MYALEFEKCCPKTLVFKQSCTLESSGAFVKLLRPGATLRGSDLIGV